MAFKKNNTTKTEKTEHSAVATIRGKLVDVYEGKKYNYLTVNVDRPEVNPKTGAHYYNRLTLTAGKDINLPDGETEVIATGYITSFFDRDVNRDKIVIECTSLTNVEAEPF